MINEYGGSFCKCPPKDKHGQTAVMCCNHCGMPDEPFWQPPTPDSEAVEWVNIQDNSDGIRSFLTEVNIEWKPNEHGTLVPAATDLYWLGRQAERFKISTQQRKLYP